MPHKDFKNEDGLWVPYVTVNHKSIHTKSFQLYKDMLLRCEVGGKYQSKYTNYAGCTTSFTSYQEFAEWCSLQVGYGEAGFELDKDILIKGNKIYGPDTCVFVPRYLNALVKNNKGRRGGCPIGTYYDKSRDKYCARLSKKGVGASLGRFDTAQGAFLAYKKPRKNM